MNIRMIWCFALVAAASLSLSAQTTSTAQTTPTTPSLASGAAGSKATSVPDSFRGITLGASMDAVKALLLADALFGYRGERDVSLLSGENRSLIETSGASYIRRAWFQFFEDALYIMTLNLDPEKIDYFSVYTSLVGKYGEPTSLDPRKAVWADDRVTLSLERPLTVKYVDAKTFSDLLGKDTTGKAASDLSRERFIDEF